VCIINFDAKILGVKFLNLKMNNNKFLVLVDNSAIEFFGKQNFIPDNEFGNDMQYYGIKYNKSIFHHYGFSQTKSLNFVAKIN